MTAVRLPVTDLAPGARLLDRFEIESELGRGGYSVVYAARDATIGDRVALKLLVPPPASAKEAKERLRREVQLVRMLRHPHIVGIHDFLEDDTRAFVVMDLIDGSDLATMVSIKGPLPLDQLLRLGDEITDALVAAHRAGILHRDLKPANILIDRTGHAWLTDFGSARLDSQASMTRTGGVVGTVAYLAPEVWLGQRPDARSDLYSLGVTLFEAATGRLPPRASPHQPPTPEPDGFRASRYRPELPPWFDQVIATATMADPRHRFATADRLRATVLERRFPTQPMVHPALGAVDPAASLPPEPRPIPGAFRFLLVGVVISGVLAGRAASPHFFWATPLVAWLLWRGAKRWATSPVPAPAAEPIRWALDGELAAIDRSLAAGPARSLLDDVLVLAQLQVEGAATPPLARRWRDQLTPLVATAVETARDLAQIDDTLHRLETGAGRVRRVPAGYWEEVASLERIRDGLSTAMLELVAALGRARGVAVDDFDSGHLRMEELLIEFKGDVGRAVEAAANLEASLTAA